MACNKKPCQSRSYITQVTWHNFRKILQVGHANIELGDSVECVHFEVSPFDEFAELVS